MSTDSKNCQEITPLPDTKFHGATIISEDGKEIPITEDMVVDACDKMDQHERK